MNIVEQPGSIAYARTPILYLVNSPLYVNSAFRYIADVYLWQDPDTKPTTPEYELRIPASNQYGSGLFDIRTLTTDWLITPEFDIGLDPDKTKEMYVNAQVHFGYVYIDGNGNVLEFRDQEIAPIITVYNGYNYYMEGVNYVPESNLGTSFPTEYQKRVYEDGGIVESPLCIPVELLGVTGDGLWLTDRPLYTCVPKWTSMHLFIVNDSTSVVRTAVVEVTTVDQGVLTSILDFDTYTSKVVAVPCGTKDIAELFLAPGVEFTSYKIYGGDDAGKQITYSYNFGVDCNDSACKYGFKNLQFLNRFGVWDNLICYGSEHNSMSVDRAEILHSPLEILEGTGEGAFNFLKPFGQYHMANIHGREMLKVNTGWIDENWNAVIKQFMLTQFLYDADTQEPYTIDKKSIAFKTALNDGLNNYTIGLKKAYTATNKIG